MKISSVGNVNFKDRQIEEFGETIITSPKTTQLDENKYWLFANKQAQMNRALVLAQIAPKEDGLYQYTPCIYSQRDIDFEIRKARRGECGEVQATVYKDGSLKTYKGYREVVDQELVKNNQGLVEKWSFNNWAQVKPALFYPTGELMSLKFNSETGLINVNDSQLPFYFLENPENKPKYVYFYPNGNVSQEIYEIIYTENEEENVVRNVSLTKEFDEETGKLVDLKVKCTTIPLDTFKSKTTRESYSDRIDTLPEYVTQPFDWKSAIPDELQEVIDENKRIAAENRRISIENRSLKNNILELYYDEKDNIIDPIDLILKDGQPFVHGKRLESYRVFQKDFKNRTSKEVKYFNGYKFIETRKKDNRTVQEDIYGHNTNERALVKKWEDDGKTYYNIARNFRFDTINTPAFLFTKKTPDTVMTVYAELKEKDDSIGLFRVNLSTSTTSRKSTFTIKKDGTYDFEAETNQDFKALQKGLVELRAFIQTDDMKADFGQYEKFNEELDRALVFIEEELGN